MKRLRSSDDLDSYEKNASKEWSHDQNRSSRSSCGLYYKPSSVSDSNARTKSNLISSSRCGREQSVADEDSGRERMVRKRAEHDFESLDRRKLEFNRYRESGSSSSGGSLRRSESFRGPRRDFPKGFRSERDRTRRENGSPWQRFGINEHRWSSIKVHLREVRDVKSPSWSRDSLVAGRVVGEAREREEMRRRRSFKSKSRSPTRSGNFGSEQSKSVDGGGGEVKKSEETLVEGETNSEMEEGEFDPEPQARPQHESATEPQAEPQHELSTGPQDRPL
ncbi:hypothetical protein HRI_003493300 [Hibiscus trionum]|uniref:Uncharacterized protein n=1 Tax=Hibiscus trionum TaxID=183268 RepID=A0A9W7MHJ6_HIBTR|nr:hypothetical protein HRI_003493300 [Hibiscus trionum]